MGKFFGFGGYTHRAEGYLSWQHLAFVTFLMVIMVTLAVILGKRNRHKPFKEQNRVIIAAAIAIDTAEILKIAIYCLRSDDPWKWTQLLPLYLCSIQLISIPLAAFTKGRIREAAQDFVCIFGLLGAVFGTYGEARNYSVCPVLSFDNIVSGFTHSVSGFVALYLFIAGMAGLKKQNIFIMFGVLLSFCAAAYAANLCLNYNYMFLMSSGGTPYKLVYNFVGGNAVLYPLSVVALFLIYIAAFYGVVYAVRHRMSVPAVSQQP